MSKLLELTDPFGNKVLLNESLCGQEAEHLFIEDHYDSVIDVITRPSMMFKTHGIEDHYYYFRAIGWNTSLMIGVKKIREQLEAQECIKNPTSAWIGNLFKNSDRLI